MIETEISVPDRAPAAAEATRPTWRRPWRSGWIPAATLAVLVVPVLTYYGVSLRDVAVFALVSVGCVTLPGTLVWRALHGRSGPLAVDAAAGTAIGIAIELAVYVAARWAGFPLGVLAFPILVVIGLAAVPSLRRHWRGGPERVPLSVAWGMAGFGLLLLVRSAMIFRTEGLTGDSALSPNIDMPFQVALVGELKNHMPPSTPYLDGEPLTYHWYAHAHGAAMSWLTGIEPQVLIKRLLILPILAAFVVLLPALARAITGRWWPGLLGLGLTYVATSTLPYGWTPWAVYDGGLFDTFWVSPTQTLAAMLFATVALGLVGLLRGTERGAGGWAAVVILIGAVAGAKATFVPMLAAGTALLLLVSLLTRRGRGPAALLFGIVAGWLLFAQFILFKGGNWGTVVAPMALVKYSPLGQYVLGTPRAANHWTALVALTGITLLSCAVTWVGLIGLLRRPWRTDPIVVLLAGAAAAGVAATYVFAHPGFSQLYFFRSARPFAGLLAGIGLYALLQPAAEYARSRWRTLAALSAGALAAGVIAVLVVKATVGRDRHPDHRLVAAVLPPAVLLAALVVLAALAWYAARATGFGRSVALLLIALTFLGSSLPHGQSLVTDPIQLVAEGKPLRNVSAGPHSQPPGAIEASRWLRDHSQPGDLVATNSHCMLNVTWHCDSRDFWLAAYSERHVLVEGWSYTETVLKGVSLYGGQLGTRPYWDPAKLAENDAVFTAPTAGSVAAFAARYNVRWLVAVGPQVSPDLGRFAAERFSAGSVRVYELPAR
jgi:hypothetical protein